MRLSMSVFVGREIAVDKLEVLLWCIVCAIGGFYAGLIFMITGLR